ncbi:MAG: hypothetical protein GFH27_549333n65 [Chloroflexi bacterium AL-W]|nr:hypothetical protein [Chloroflexi bacterium AL-N1]NOK70482.1 hypothetical protein [Chloroflexi bacterium AL-N10]NOK78159.1 hypothetical protein [Chloroflexi bacterium AL-N5]NOK85258.1 hypothetical protein [Chloroflexi bacterium AL-W]NOK92023.1 hypothetical protein [Chloroflexi bacterium AL-N15]
MSHSAQSGMRVLIVAAVLMWVGVSIATAPVDAGWPCYDDAPRTCSFICIYYSNAQHTTQVGYWFWRCHGTSTRSGQTTA